MANLPHPNAAQLAREKIADFLYNTGVSEATGERVRLPGFGFHPSHVAAQDPADVARELAELGLVSDVVDDEHLADLAEQVIADAYLLDLMRSDGREHLARLVWEWLPCPLTVFIEEGRTVQTTEGEPGEHEAVIWVEGSTGRAGRYLKPNERRDLASWIEPASFGIPAPPPNI